MNGNSGIGVIVVVVVLAGLSLLLITVGCGGVTDRLGVLGDNVTKQVDRFLGEDEVRIKEIETKLTKRLSHKPPKRRATRLFGM